MISAQVWPRHRVQFCYVFIVKLEIRREEDEMLLTKMCHCWGVKAYADRRSGRSPSSITWSCPAGAASMAILSWLGAVGYWMSHGLHYSTPLASCYCPSSWSFFRHSTLNLLDSRRQPPPARASTWARPVSPFHLGHGCSPQAQWGPTWSPESQ